jgi:hypothetical protein
MPHAIRRFWLSALLLAVCSMAAGADAAPPSASATLQSSPDDGGDGFDRIDSALRTLRFGSPEERLEVASKVKQVFSELGGHDDDKPGSAPILNTLLDVLLEDERDEWIRFTLSRGLVEVDGRTLNPLFAELLGHPSPNVRRSAGLHFSSHRVDEESARQLDRAWRREVHLRVQQALLGALSFNERSTHANDLLELIWSDDPDLAHTAIVELSLLKPAGALQALAERSFDGPLWIREEALSNLLEWKGSPEVAAVHAEHIVGDEPTLRNYAARQLRWLEHPDVALLLARLVKDPAVDLCVRRAAAASIDPTHPEAEEALLSLLAEPTTPDNADVQRAAAYRLSRAEMSAIDPTAIPNEERHFDCEWNAAPGGWQVEPPESLASIRCWEAPGRRVHPNREARLARGRKISPRDYFDSEEASWMLDEEGCWVRADYVIVAGGDPAGRADEGEDTQDEIDPLQTLRSVLRGPLAH